MLRRMFVIAVIAVSFLTGCKKDSGESVSEEPVVKSEAEYAAEAKEQITEENMQAELEKLEKSIEQDIQAEE